MFGARKLHGSPNDRYVSVFVLFAFFNHTSELNMAAPVSTMTGVSTRYSCIHRSEHMLLPDEAAVPCCLCRRTCVVDVFEMPVNNILEYRV